MNPKQFPNSLQPVARLIEAGRTAEARNLLRPILETDSKNADAWYLASLLTDKTPQKIVALKRALALNPNHTHAQTSLAQLQMVDDLLDGLAVAEPKVPPPKPVPPKPRSPAQRTYTRRQKRIFIAAGIMGLGLLALMVFIINTPQKYFAMMGASGSIVFDMGGLLERHIYIMDASNLNPVNLTPGYAYNAAPVLSSDGAQIAYVSNRDGRSDIYVMNADGSNPRRLTFDIYLKDKPAWSPDGKTILYQKKLQDHWALYMMNADGSNTRILLQAEDFDYQEGKWSPDGTQITFGSNRDGNDEIYVMNADTTNIRRLTNHLAADYDPSWSPDSNQIAFTSQREDSEGESNFLLNDDSENDPVLYVMDVDGKNLRMLAEQAYAAEWSPDGDRIIFSGLTDDSDEIYIIDADGGDPIRLTDSPEPTSSSSWGYIHAGAVLVPVTSDPLPYEVVFSRLDLDGNRKWQLYTLDTACASTPAGCIEAAVPFLTSVNPPDPDKDYPAWSPDGSKLAFVTTAGAYYDLSVWDTFTEQQHILTNNRFVEESPAWSPDGSRIAFVSSSDHGKNIHVMDADGKNVRPLTTTDINGNPAWSPDGTQLAFTAFWSSIEARTRCADVFVMDADGGNRRNLTNDCADYDTILWSPDGRQILFAAPYHASHRSERKPYFIIDADGSNRHELPLDTDSTEEWLLNGGAAWTPDGEYVVFGGYDVFLVRLDGSFIQRLTNSWDYYSDPSVRLLPR